MSCTSRNNGNFVHAMHFHTIEHVIVTMRGRIGGGRATQRHPCEHDRVRWRPFGIGYAGAAIGGAGLVLVAIGTFLPWLKSGSVLRDSYESISAIRTIGIIRDSPLNLVIDAWTMIIPVITLCVAAYAFGFRRSAATVAAIVALFCGTIGGGAAVESGGEEVSLGIAGTGPTVTFIGGVLALLGVIGVFIGLRTRATNVSGGDS
jgi:hypothetical protein